MMKNSANIVEDTEENRQICRKYCGACPTYKHNSFEGYQPNALFCAGKPSTAPTKKVYGCFCPACELFDKHNLAIGRFCAGH